MFDKYYVEIALIVLTLLCLPNLWYRASLNIPILLFVALTWKMKKQFASQLLIISWIVELYQLLDILVNNNNYVNPQKNPVLLTFTILVFVLKAALIIWLIVKDEEFRLFVSLRGWITSMGKGMIVVLDISVPLAYLTSYHDTRRHKQHFSDVSGRLIICLLYSEGMVGILQLLLPFYLSMATSRKVPVATMDSYSRNHKYTQTFFHYPTRNPHSQLQYQMRLSQKQIKTFQPKKKGQYQSLMYESALNPLAHSKSHHQPNLNVTGDRKRQVQPFSVKSTDPITLCYEVKQPQNKLARPFEATLSYTRDIQRRNYLPITRQYSRPNRNYHSQLGYSLQAKDRVRTKPQLNNSNNMNSTIQYKDNKMMRTTTCFDDFKYNSRK